MEEPEFGKSVLEWMHRLLPKIRKRLIRKSGKFGANGVKKANFGGDLLEPIRTLDLVEQTKAQLLQERIQDQSKTNKTTFASHSINAIDSIPAKFGGSKPHFNHTRRDLTHFDRDSRSLDS